MLFKTSRKVLIIVLTATITLTVAVSGILSFEEQRCNDHTELLRYKYLDKKMIDLQYENSIAEGNCLRKPNESCIKYLLSPHNNNETDAGNMAKELDRKSCKYYTIPLGLLHILEVICAFFILIIVLPDLKKT